VDCLVAIGPKLFKLSVSEKEVYYSEVKNLICIIKSKQQEQIDSQKEDSRSGDSEMDIDSGSYLRDDTSRPLPH